MHFALISFFFNDPATPEIYTLPLPALLPISSTPGAAVDAASGVSPAAPPPSTSTAPAPSATRQPSPSASRPRRTRSEEHTSELQSRPHVACLLLLAHNSPRIQIVQHHVSAVT